MTDYDLLVLSPIEFEDITKDLLEKRFSIEFEIFGAGRDEGIDLRYSKTKSADVIIQCKRYKDYAPLKAAIKKEKTKIEKLKPQRYVLATTVSLNPGQKTEIIKLLAPFIKKNSDILGKTEINSLISRYPSVEKKHYKLWLSSTTVLQNLLHSKVTNQSELELRNVKKNLKTYAENPSYSEALKTLQNNHFVIISGLPGIGKTTLARIMVYRLLGDRQFDEFVFVSGSVDEVYEMFDEHKKQLFLFDDFLGTNFLEQKMARNEDSRLLEFVKMVKRSKNTALILTTREYILKQAQGTFAKLDDHAISDGKYIIDLSEYTKLVKARILYNHLFAAKIPAKYLEEFLEQKVYKAVIEHKNYSPRLIEVVLNEKPWEAFTVKEFPSGIVEYFEKPYRIWENIFENEISENARSILEVLLTTTGPIKLDDLVAATQQYLHHKGVESTRAKVDKALKELDGTFIATTLKDADVIVNYQNPSVYDFLRDYYNSKRQDDLIGVIKSAKFLNQLTEIFTSNTQSYRGKITMQDSMKSAITQKILDDFTDMSWCSFSRWGSYPFRDLAMKHPILLEKIHKVLFDLGLSNNRQVVDIMFTHYQDYLVNRAEEQPYVNDALELLELFHERLSAEEIDLAIYNASLGINSFADLEEVDSVEADFTFAYEKLVESEYFNDSAQDALINEADELEEERISNFLDNVSNLASKYGLDLMSIEEMLIEKEREAQAIEASDFYTEDIKTYTGYSSSTTKNSSSSSKPYAPPPSEEEIIDGMFSSLN